MEIKSSTSYWGWPHCEKIGGIFWKMYHSIFCSYLQPLSFYWRIVQFVDITVSWVVTPHLKGYRNRYNLIDCGHKRIAFTCFEEDFWPNSSYDCAAWDRRHQSKFVEIFSELIRNLSDVAKIFLFHNHLVY